MRVRIRAADAYGKELPLDDASWVYIQLASYLHGREVSDEELNLALSLACREEQTAH